MDDVIDPPGRLGYTTAGLISALGLKPAQARHLMDRIAAEDKVDRLGAESSRPATRVAPVWALRELLPNVFRDVPNEVVS